MKDATPITEADILADLIEPSEPKLRPDYARAFRRHAGYGDVARYGNVVLPIR